MINSEGYSGFHLNSGRITAVCLVQKVAPCLKRQEAMNSTMFYFGLQDVMSDTNTTGNFRRWNLSLGIHKEKQQPMKDYCFL